MIKKETTHTRTSEQAEGRGESGEESSGGGEEKYIPWGMGDEDTGQLSLTFGSSATTSDFMVETREARWTAVAAQEQATTEQMQIKMDNAPESRGVRTISVNLSPCEGAQFAIVPQR